MLANKLFSLGDTFIVEKMSLQGLQKRTKRTEKNDKGKFKKKKRFGKSIANHAPSTLLQILEQKVKMRGGIFDRINPADIKASQYNHIDGTYTKATLNQRWKQLDETTKVQRDLYSAFILQHLFSPTEIDRTSCINDFETFKHKHDKLIEKLIQMKHSGKYFPSCMGIK